MPENLIAAPARYKKYPGDPDRVYRALCYTLSERVDEVDWGAFTEADWKILPAMAEYEGVAPLMYWKLNASQPQKAKIPHPVFEALQESYYQTLARNTLLFYELDHILMALDDAGIPVILLKGAALAQSLYEDIGLRPMGDLDILVKYADIPKIRKILCDIGYFPEMSRLRCAILTGIIYEMNFYKDSRSETHVELHWNLIGERFSKYKPDIYWFWSRNVRRENTRVLDSTAHLTYLCAHYVIKHTDERRTLIWLYDIDQLVENQPNGIDWTELEVKASEFNWNNAVSDCLTQVGRLLNTELPTLFIPDSKALLHPSHNLETRKIYRGFYRYGQLYVLGWIGLSFEFIIPRHQYLRDTFFYGKHKKSGYWFLLISYWKELGIQMLSIIDARFSGNK